ncbi:hypothetical protein BD410DRAFT_509058 [Rickenella mellea]|uniref:Uncharacterized protein n=1 Tax=Rickenella mellea TaxID=50990 RepID=A0A4Y7PRN0_9AGAM|nr:hypothetical protein BD410DRAFT_509058 [Rickenella mellea]
MPMRRHRNAMAISNLIEPMSQPPSSRGGIPNWNEVPFWGSNSSANAFEPPSWLSLPKKSRAVSESTTMTSGSGLSADSTIDADALEEEETEFVPGFTVVDGLVRPIKRKTPSSQVHVLSSFACALDNGSNQPNSGPPPSSAAPIDHCPSKRVEILIAQPTSTETALPCSTSTARRPRPKPSKRHIHFPHSPLKGYLRKGYRDPKRLAIANKYRRISWKCPHPRCKYVQHTRKFPDLVRHTQTHKLYKKFKWACVGIVGGLFSNTLLRL